MGKLIKLLINILIVLVSSVGCSESITNEKLEALDSAFSLYEVDEAIKIINDNENDENFKEKCILIISNYVEKYKLKYEMNEIEYDTYIKINQVAYEVIGDQSYEEIIEDLEKEKENLTLHNEASKLIEEKDYINAVKKLNDIEPEYKNYNEVIRLINENAVEIKEKNITKINEYTNNKNFTEAINLVDELIKLFPDDTSIYNFKNEINQHYEDYNQSIEIKKYNIENKKKEENAYNEAYEKILEACKKKAWKEARTNKVELVYDGIFILEGKEYYSFTSTINGITSGDCKQLVKKDDYNMYSYYSNGDLFPLYEDGTCGKKITSIDNPIDISIGELCKNPIKYQSQYVRITGIISYINESIKPNDIIIVNDRNESVNIKYWDNTTYVKGDIVTVTGLVISTTSEFSLNGIPVTMPKLDFGKID